MGAFKKQAATRSEVPDIGKVEVGEYVDALG